MFFNLRPTGGREERHPSALAVVAGALACAFLYRSDDEILARLASHGSNGEAKQDNEHAATPGIPCVAQHRGMAALVAREL